MYKTILIFLFYLIGSNFVQAVDVSLELVPGQGKKTVRLPFDYAHLSPQDKENITFVHERFYTVLEDDKPNKALVGILSPCLVIALRNEEQGKTIVFHKHYSNNLQKLIEIAKKELNITNPDSLKGEIFTNNPDYYDKPNPGKDKRSLKDLHQGRTLHEEVKHIKDTLIQSLHIRDRQQIRAQIFTNLLKEGELGDYELAELSILVDSKLKLNCVSIIHENVFGNFNQTNISYIDKVRNAVLTLNKQLNFLTSNHFAQKFKPDEFKKYDHLPFALIR